MEEAGDFKESGRNDSLGGKRERGGGRGAALDRGTGKWEEEGWEINCQKACLQMPPESLLLAI